MLIAGDEAKGGGRIGLGSDAKLGKETELEGVKHNNVLFPARNGSMTWQLYNGEIAGVFQKIPEQGGKELFVEGEIIFPVCNGDGKVTDIVNNVAAFGYGISRLCGKGEQKKKCKKKGG